MSSFIDLMANDNWSDADIVRRTEAILSSQFPNSQILQRKVQGQMLGQYTLTADEQAQLQAYAAASFAAGADADQARADMDLLRRTWAVEAAQTRLAQPVVDGDDQDAAERAAAQAVIDAATPDALALAAQRAQTIPG
jgi:hypothetical protein